MPFVIIELMEPVYKNKRAKIRPVIPEQENDGLRILARIIARVHIQNELNKVESQDSDEGNNNDNSKPLCFRTK